MSSTPERSDDPAASDDAAEPVAAADGRQDTDKPATDEPASDAADAEDPDADGAEAEAAGADGADAEDPDADGAESGEPGADGAAPVRRRGWFRRRTWWQMSLIVLGVVVLLCSVAGVGGALALAHRYESQVKHENLLGDAVIPKQEQEQHFRSGPINLLLLGSDSREGEANKEQVYGQRSDTIMLVHINKDHDQAAIISIPRDSYVNVPAAGEWRGGPNKINAAFAYGGAPLAARTITELTGVQLDGAMIANFSGIRTMVDAVGGVNVCVDRTIKSIHSSRVWTKGCHDMDGAAAEDFMRQRKNLPDGDFGRMKDQQLVVKAVLEKASSGDLLTNPLSLDRLIMTAAQALTIDKSLDLRLLAMTVKSIRYSSVQFATVPHSKDDLRTAVGSAVVLDEQKSKEMFAAIQNDTINQWIVDHPAVTKVPTTKPAASQSPAPTSS